MPENEIVKPEVWADLVVLGWRQQGLRLSEGASHLELAQAEERLGYRFDSFFRALYSRTNGFGTKDWLGHIVVLWPLDQIVQERSLHSSGSFIAFGDYMINSAEYCFQKGEEGVFKLYDLAGNPVERAASSFTEFISMVNRDDMLVY